MVDKIKHFSAMLLKINQTLPLMPMRELLFKSQVMHGRSRHTEMKVAYESFLTNRQPPKLVFKNTISLVTQHSLGVAGRKLRGKPAAGSPKASGHTVSVSSPFLAPYPFLALIFLLSCFSFHLF